MVLQGKRGIDDAADSKSFFFSLYLNESIRSFFSHTQNEEKKEEEREIDIDTHHPTSGTCGSKKPKLPEDLPIERYAAATSKECVIIIISML